MKIAILVHNLTGGGAERVASLWAAGFSQQGKEVVVILTDDNSPITYSLPKSVRILYISSHHRNRLIRIVQKLNFFRKTIITEKPDVIIGVLTHFRYYLSIIGLHTPFINTEHYSFERPVSAPMTIKGKIKKFILNRLYNQVTVLTMADYMIANKNLHNIAVLPNPLAFPTAKIIPQKKQTVLAIGRLDAWHYKGFDVLIKAWSRIATNTSQWRLQIVGNGNKGKFYLRGLCQELGVSESVEFIDYQDDIQPFYQSAAIFVLCSRYEGFGMVLIEAMSQGCACIASDYKGRQREIIRNENEGVLCEPENITQLAEAIKRLINEKEKREHIARNAIERSKEYSLDKIMQKWDEILYKQ